MNFVKLLVNESARTFELLEKIIPKFTELKIMFQRDEDVKELKTQ